jgi:hypothetical protein
MRNPFPYTFLTLALVMGASCAQVEADVPEAQITKKGVSFHGTGWGGHHDEVSATQSFTLSSENLSWVKDLNSKIYVTEIDLEAVSGVQDLSFIHYAHVSIADADSKFSMPVTIVDYVRPDNMASSATLTAKTPYPIDISKVWTAKKILVTVSLAGDLPEKSWSVDVIIHLSGKIAYKL